jgi:hypothetical protein
MTLVRVGRLTALLAAPVLVALPSAGEASPGLAAGGPDQIALESDGMRCGSRLVEIGDSKSDVVAKCGRAAYEDERYEERRDREGRRYVVRVDDWTYDLGKGSFLRHLTFENGSLRDIRAGTRVE